MERASLAWPQAPRAASPRGIPLSLALPAGGAALVAVTLVVTLIVLWSRGSEAEQPLAQTTAAAPRSEAAVGPAGASQPPQPSELDRQFEAARARHEAGQHLEAFALLTALADRGHCEAARQALLLLRAGPEAYLTTFDARPEQMARWRALPGCWTRVK